MDYGFSTMGEKNVENSNGKDLIERSSPDIDEDLHSRQLAVYGRDTMRCLFASNILVSGMQGLGAEIAKNLVLAGVKSVTFHDEGNVELWDLSSSFVFSEDDVGKNHALASLPKLQELNNSVVVSALTTELTKEHLAGFQYRESEHSDLGGFERKLMDENLKPGLALSSWGSDESVVHKSLARENYREKNSSVRYPRDDNYRMEQSRTQPTSFDTGSLALLEKENPGSLTSNSHIYSGKDRFNAEMIDSTIVHDALDGEICGKSSVTRTYPPVDNVFVGKEHENDTYNESWRNKRGNVLRESDDFHASASAADDYSHVYFDSTVDKVDECYYEELSGDNRVWYDDSYLQGNKILSNNDLNMSPARIWDNDIVDRRNAYERYEREQYVYQRSPLSADDHGYERSELSPWSEYGQHNVNYDHRSPLLEGGHGHERSGTFPFMENDQYLDEF